MPLLRRAVPLGGLAVGEDCLRQRPPAGAARCHSDQHGLALGGLGPEGAVVRQFQDHLVPCGEVEKGGVRDHARIAGVVLDDLTLVGIEPGDLGVEHHAPDRGVRPLALLRPLAVGLDPREPGGLTPGSEVLRDGAQALAVQDLLRDLLGEFHVVGERFESLSLYLAHLDDLVAEGREAGHPHARGEAGLYGVECPRPDRVQLALGEDGEDLGEHLAHGGGHVDPLLGRHDDLAVLLAPLDDLAEVGDPATQPVDLHDAERVPKALVFIVEPLAEVGALEGVESAGHVGVRSPGDDSSVPPRRLHPVLYVLLTGGVSPWNRRCRRRAAGNPGRAVAWDDPSVSWWMVSLFRFDGHRWCGGQAASAVSYSAGLR